MSQAETPAAVAIRDAAPADRATLVGFLAALQDYERTLEADRSEGAAMAEGHLAYLQRIVAERGGMVLLAEQDGRPVGFLIGVVEVLEEGDLHVKAAERRFGYVSDLFVASEARRRGLGAALLGEAERRFRAAGLTSVAISYLARNKPAARLYRRFGFAPYEATMKKAL